MSTPSLFLMLTLLLSGNPEVNPGPMHFTDPCGMCSKGVWANHKGIQCDECDIWYHSPCIGMTNANFKSHQKDATLDFICAPTTPEANADNDGNHIVELGTLRRKNRDNIIAAHLSINGMKSKFVMVIEILYLRETGGYFSDW